MVIPLWLVVVPQWLVLSFLQRAVMERKRKCRRAARPWEMAGPEEENVVSYGVLYGRFTVW